MLRREFITFVGGAVASPLVARAQQPKRRIGMLMATAEGDATGQARARAFLDGIQRLGWTDGRNVIVDIRWAAGNPDKYVTELLALAPDVILASASVNVAALQRATQRVPLVFANVIDPVGAGFVASLARPGGNTTGFSAFEYSLSGKWLELLIEIAPNLTRIAVLRDPSLAAGIGQFAAVQALAPSSLGAELFPIDSRDPGVIEPAIAAFARERNGGLIVTASQSAVTHRNLIISLALRHRLPNIYGTRRMGVLLPTGLMPSTCIHARLNMLIAFLKEKSPPTCQYKRLPNTSWSSILRPPSRLMLPFRERCSTAPTRSSSRSLSGYGTSRQFARSGEMSGVGGRPEVNGRRSKRRE
jgi:putative ABC transport system substrate-binding protein